MPATTLDRRRGNRECRRLPKNNYFAFRRSTDRGGKWSMISSAQVYDLPAIDRQWQISKSCATNLETSDFNG
jgi:hypothetical protein